MNGVIVDDESVHEMAFTKVLGRYNYKLTHEEYMNFWYGKTDRDGFLKIINKPQFKNIDVNDLVREKAEEYFKNITGQIKSYRGVLELINDLEKKYKLALVSNSSRRDVDLILNNLKIYNNFRVIISLDDLDKAKPDPEPYNKALSLLDEKSENCLVIEDSPAGIESAKRAGMICWAILTTNRREKLIHADKIFENFLQIKKVLIN